MADARNLAALMRHAADAGDVPLLLAITRWASLAALRRAPASRAYATLVVDLGMTDVPAGYDRR